MIDDQMLHTALSMAVARLREQLSDANVGSQFKLEIDVTGRLNSSEPCVIAYKVSDSIWGGGPEGNRLGPVIEEFLRRKGWQAKYAPTMLPAPEDVVEPPPAPQSK